MARRIPKQIYPKGIEREYTRFYLSLVKRLESRLVPLLSELPTLLNTRQDVGEQDRIAELVEELSNSLEINTSELKNIAETFGERVIQHSTTQLARQVKSALQVDLFFSGGPVAQALDNFVGENVMFFRDLTNKTIDNINNIMTRGVTAGQLHKEIAKDIQETIKVSKRRAKLIARDQVGKFYGQVQKVRQEEIGVKEFIWRSVGDQRVRPLHNSIDGQTYSWEKGGHPSEGMPGEPVLCRCYAEPVLSVLSGII